jgi:hypothetical protein
MSYTIVTSFSKEGYNKYAQEMLKTFKKYWDKDIQLEAWYHDFELPKSAPKAKNITYKNLNDDKDMLNYRERMSKYSSSQTGNKPYDWKRDCIKWCHKVYALTSSARNHYSDTDWLIWLDADTVTHSPITSDFLNKVCSGDKDIVHLGRNDIDYSETSFIGINLRSMMGKEFLEDFRGCYDAGETIAYREWHDGFIFDRLLIVHKAHGLIADNLTPNVKGIDAFGQSVLNKVMYHNKGMKKDGDALPPRYKFVGDMVDYYKPKTILETGTNTGARAIMMISHALKHTDSVHYIGYDLFEDTTPELNLKEFNNKQVFTLKKAEEKLKTFASTLKEKGKTLTYKLYKGDVKETLKEKIDADFVLIGGGTSYNTVHHTYEMLKHNVQIVLDDYFRADKGGKKPDEEYCGVNKVVEEITYPNAVLGSSDPALGTGLIGLVVVNHKKENIFQPKVPIVVTPKDSMPKEHILKNIKENFKILPKWMNHSCIANDESIILVSAGPSVDIDLIKKQIEENPKAKVVCVKHSYPLLLSHGIKPWVCTILDPRPVTGLSTHGIVRTDLFKTVDPSTLFLVAGMTDVSVTKLLIEKHAQIIGWHAYSEAVANGVPDLAKDITWITGGTNAAMRSVSIMHTLGFRDFKLHGFDFSLSEPPKDPEKLDEEGQKSFLKVNVDKESFWTTGELLAGAQDLEKFFDTRPKDITLSLHGEGLGGTLWKTNGSKKLSPNYKDVLYG